MPSEENAEFADPAAYPYMVVCSPSSHDTTTTRCWYEEDEERRERYYYKVREDQRVVQLALAAWIDLV